MPKDLFDEAPCLVPPSILEMTLPGLAGKNAVYVPVESSREIFRAAAEKVVPHDVFMQRRGK